MGRIADRLSSSTSSIPVDPIAARTQDLKAQGVPDWAISKFLEKEGLQEEGKSITGFIENVFRSTGEGIAHIAEGVGATAGAVVHDTLVNGLKQAVNPHADVTYYTDDILKSLPGAVADRASQYFNDPLDLLYEDPFGVALDAYSVASAGAGTAARGAKVVGNTAAVGDDLARLAQGASDVSGVAKAVDALLPGMKYQKAGIRAPSGEVMPLGGVRNAINSETGRLIERSLSTNPVKRAVESARFNMRSETLGNLEKQAGVLDGLLQSGVSNPTKVAAKLGQIEQVLNVARELDVPTVYKPTASARLAGRAARRIFAESGSKFISNRTEAINNYARVQGPAIDKHGEQTVFDSYLGFNTVQSAGRATFDEVRAAAANADPSISQIGEAVQPLIDKVDQMVADGADPIAIDKARRLVEIVGGEPLAAKTAGHVDDLADAMDNTRLVNMSQEAKAMLESGYPVEEMFDHLYQSLQIKEAIDQGIDLDGVENLDDVVPSALELDDLRQKHGVKAPVYYPQPTNVHKPMSSYLMKTRKSGAVSASVPSSAKKWTGRNLRAYVEGTVDALDTNPMEAYSRLAAEWTGYRSMLQMMDKLKTEIGMKFPDRASVPEGWMTINPRLNRIILRKHLDIRTHVTKLLADGIDQHDALIQAVKDAFHGDKMEKELAELLDSAGEVFAVPEAVARQFDEAGKSYLNPALNKNLRLYHDPLMNAWRTSTLYLRPAFYMNNIVGNTVFLKLQGASVGRMMAQLNADFRKSLQNVADQLGVRGDLESGLFDTPSFRSTHLGSAENTRTGQFYKSVKESKVGRGAGIAAEAGRKVGAIFEDAARREAFLTAAERDLMRRGVMGWASKWGKQQKRLDQILKYGIDNPRAVGRWLDEANDVMNNYRALGPFERKVIKRFIAPFWPFYKHATLTLAKMPFEHPLKAELLKNIGEVNHEMLDELVGIRPEWASSMLPGGEGAIPGTTRFESSSGWNPFNVGLGQSPTGLLGPAIQTGMQQIMGIDPLTLKALRNPNAYTDPYTGDSYTLDPETNQAVPLKRSFFGLRAANAPTVSQSLMGSVPILNQARDLIEGGARDKVTGALIRDESGNARYPVDPLQELLQWMGYSTVDLNIPQYQESEMKRRQAATSELLERSLLGP